MSIHRITFIGLALIGLMVGSLFALTAFAAQEEEPIICDAPNLQIALRSGPSAPLDLSGRMRLWVNADGTFTGLLYLASDGTEIYVNGQGSGVSINLVFYPPNGLPLFALGSQEFDIRECQGTGAGYLSGPEHGDVGDWVNRPPYVRLPPLDPPPLPPDPPSPPVPPATPSS
jgi:hypothetical protein